MGVLFDLEPCHEIMEDRSQRLVDHHFLEVLVCHLTPMTIRPTSRLQELLVAGAGTTVLHRLVSFLVLEHLNTSCHQIDCMILEDDP
jgi:hypothetical protein